MKNFHVACWNKLMAVRLILAFLAQKRLIPTSSFYTNELFVASPKKVCSWQNSGSWNIFVSPIRASYWLLDSFRRPEPKNAWFLLSRHDVRRVHEKLFFSPIRASYWLLDSFWPPEPKKVWFLLSRHDVLRVHEIFSSRRFERAIGC